MGKLRRNTTMKSLNTTAREALPVVDKGLQTVGTTAKDVAQSSIPLIERGVSGVYGTMATGLDLGVKSAKSIAKNVTKSRHSRSRHISRRRKMAGARKSKRRHYRK